MTDRSPAETSGPASDALPVVGGDPPPRTFFYRALTAALRLVLAPFLWTSYRHREKVPPRGGILLVANHQSVIDIPLLSWAAKPRHVSFVARDTLAKRALPRMIMERTGTVLVRRGQSDAKALREIVARLEAGGCVAIFPEGTRTPDGHLQEFRRGALLAARRAGVPILPVAIDGCFGVWPRSRRLPRPGRVTVTFGSPLSSRGSDALDRVRGSISEMLGEPRIAEGTDRPTGANGAEGPDGAEGAAPGPTSTDSPGN